MFQREPTLRITVQFIILVSKINQITLDFAVGRVLYYITADSETES